MPPVPCHTPSASRPILLFDGVCGLCNMTVDFIISHDREHRFIFTPLQSPAGQAALRRSGLDEHYIDSIVLIDGDAVHTHSTAALHVARLLGGLWKVFYLLIACPPFVRDALYDFIARHRYAWFGKRDACRTPTAAERGQFVTDLPAAPTIPA